MASNLHLLHVAEVVDPVQARARLVEACRQALTGSTSGNTGRDDMTRKRTGKQALHAVGVGADEGCDFAAREVRGGMGRQRDVVAELVKLHVLADLRQK